MDLSISFCELAAFESGIKAKHPMGRTRADDELAAFESGIKAKHSAHRLPLGAVAVSLPDTPLDKPHRNAWVIS